MIAAASVNWHYLLILVVPSVFVVVFTALTWYARSRRPPGSGSGRSRGSSGGPAGSGGKSSSAGGKSSVSGGKSSGSGGKSSGSGGKRSGSAGKRRRT
jgi:hypothetical protein